jgi:hypothetical protein
MGVSLLDKPWILNHLVETILGQLIFDGFQTLWFMDVIFLEGKGQVQDFGRHSDTFKDFVD